MTAPRKLRVGLALGSGSARGWAHIGVIRALEAAGIHPDVVCGTSIGALVGGAYVAGELDRLEEWVKTLKMKDVIAFMDFTLSGGLVRGGRLMDHFREHFTDRQIEQIATPFAAVATALDTGAEIWLRSGSIFEAVRASVAVPGFFAPVFHDGMVLVDGGLVNPVPVSLTRALGADIVIAVDPRCVNNQHRHHAGTHFAQPHGRGAARPHRGPASGPFSNARLSAGRGSHSGRPPCGAARRPQPGRAQSCSDVNRMALVKRVRPLSIACLAPTPAAWVQELSRWALRPALC